MTRLRGSRRGNYCLTLAALLGCATNARAATRGLSDADLIYLGYAFVVIPLYGVLMGTALGLRLLATSARSQTVARHLRACANLLPLTLIVAFFSYLYLARPMLPGHYSDLGFFVTWGCILSPLPLVLLANYLVSRWAKLHQVAASPWWLALYAVIATGVVATMYFGN